MHTWKKGVVQLLSGLFFVGMVFALFLLFQSPPARFVDIGTPSDASFIKDFFLPEMAAGILFRWSSADAALLLPGSSNGHLLLAMRLNGDVRVQRASPRIDLTHASVPLSRFDLQPGWRVYRVLLPPGSTVDPILKPAPLVLHTAPILHEKRSLGIPIDWIRFSPLQYAPLPIGVPLQRSLLFIWGLVGLAVTYWTIDLWLLPRLDKRRLFRVALVCAVCGIGIVLSAWHDPYLLDWYVPAFWVVIGGLVGVLSPYWVRLGHWIAADKGDEVPQAHPVSLPAWWYVVYGSAALCFTAVYFTQTAEYEDATLQSLTAFTAFVPYQYRVLLPSIVHILAVIVPLPLRFFYIGMTILCVFFILIVFRRFLGYFIFDSTSNWSCLFILYPMVWNYGFLSIFLYPSDILAVLLFMLGLLSILWHRWRWYYAVFIIAAWNRETSCFLTFAFVFVMLGRTSLRSLALHGGLQLLIWIATRGLVTYLFRDNFGDRVFQNQLAHNSLFLHDLAMFQPFALARLGTFGGLWLCIPFLWKQQPLVLKRLLWVLVPFIAGMSVVGLLYEARIYSELIPIVTASVLYSLHRVWTPLALRRSKDIS